ncbi:hypothetical protein [uncultured Flavobacterium sp.]|uniref:hypothetical protein n=1 Tax=uncultured Flavobacterium sp. TaxID=165435 RepID=UPI00259307E1|nr:hypothetical protein [uncultured Flavobacterium sp.]
MSFVSFFTSGVFTSGEVVGVVTGVVTGGVVGVGVTAFSGVVHTSGRVHARISPCTFA